LRGITTGAAIHPVQLTAALGAIAATAVATTITATAPTPTVITIPTIIVIQGCVFLI
jgi:hypothetical protein